MESCKLILLPAFGKKEGEGMVIWADARSEKQLHDNGFEVTDAEETDFKYYGVRLDNDIILRAGSDNKDALKDAGFYIAMNESNALTGGRYLWVRKFGKEEMLKPWVI